MRNVYNLDENKDYNKKKNKSSLTRTEDKLKYQLLEIILFFLIKNILSSCFEKYIKKIKVNKKNKLDLVPRSCCKLDK